MRVVEDLFSVIKCIDGVDYKIVLSIDDLGRCSPRTVGSVWPYQLFVPLTALNVTLA